MAEGAPLLREYGLIPHRGFESLPLRQPLARSPSFSLFLFASGAFRSRLPRPLPIQDDRKRGPSPRHRTRIETDEIVLLTGAEPKRRCKRASDRADDESPPLALLPRLRSRRWRLIREFGSDRGSRLPFDNDAAPQPASPSRISAQERICSRRLRSIPHLFTRHRIENLGKSTNRPRSGNRGHTIFSLTSGFCRTTARRRIRSFNRSQPRSCKTTEAPPIQLPNKEACRISIHS